MIVPHESFNLSKLALAENWEGIRLKYGVQLINKKAEFIYNYVGLENVESWTGKLIKGNENFSAEDAATANNFNSGDVLLSKLRPYLAKAFIAQESGCCTSELLVLRPIHYDANYLKYLILTLDFINLVNSSTYGVKMPRANWEFIGNIKIPKPPIEVQKVIASFLDHKTAAIDALIAKKQCLIELLEEKRSALINQVVTKGLNPNAPMKASGIPWIGEIPQHWKVIKLGRFAEVTKLTGFEYTKYWSVDPEGEIIALRGFNIKNNKLILDDVERISSELSKKLLRSKLFAGDIVFPCTGTLGNGAIIEDNNKFHINQNIAKLTLKQNWHIEQKYLLYQLCSYAMKYQIDRFNSSGLQPVLLIGTIRNLTCFLPPEDEQKDIIKFLDVQLDIFESITSCLLKQIARLKEYRQSLITAAVTGKLDITQEEAA